MTILGKIDNGEHLNIDRDDYFDHDERDQILRHFTLQYQLKERLHFRHIRTSVK